LQERTEFLLDTLRHFFYYVEIMPKGDSLGEFENLILLAVLRLNDDAYGMRVRREIADRTSRDVTIGAVYATLDRLETKGLVSASVTDPKPERGGRAKRSFRVTAQGIEAIHRTRHETQTMSEGLVFPV
jgi:DNA-binding PadR family transcriptional regulator